MRFAAMVVAGIGLAGLGFAVLGTPAAAFQETPIGTVQPGAGVASGDLKLSPDKAPGGDSGRGTEIRIPGYGKLGVLPKLDFGLELLYGADQKAEADKGVPGQGRNPAEDLAIHGTVKHRF